MSVSMISSSDCEPLVSIIMNCFNGEKYLKEALNSLLAQEYVNWELIFWDNQSTDKSAEILHSYQDSRIHYFLSKTFLHLGVARNEAINQARGEIIAFLDVDDWWDSKKLKLQIPLFLDRRVGLCCSNFWIYNQRKSNKSIASRAQMPSGRAVNDLLTNYSVGLLTLMIRREYLESEPYIFDPSYVIICDFDLVIRLARKYEIASIDEPLAYYRRHDSNESIRKFDILIKELEDWEKKQLTKAWSKEYLGFKSFSEFIKFNKACHLKCIGKHFGAIKIFFGMKKSIFKLKLFLIILLPKYFLLKIRR